MARKPKWKYEGYDKGVETFTLSSWKYFHDFIQEQFLDYKTYVYRGQEDENWLLEPGINRLIKANYTQEEYIYKLIKHLDNFKFSIRGRAPSLKDIIDNENELWALGQHNGLKTPLLDFSFSPYVAAYFAFIDNITNSKYRIVYAVAQSAIPTIPEIKNKVTLFKPLSDNNPRLLNQNALFVKFHTQEDLESIIKTTYDNHNKVVLCKIKIPNKDREICLRMLNRMNINHNTLFPDLYGASIHSNIHLEIDKY